MIVFFKNGDRNREECNPRFSQLSRRMKGKCKRTPAENLSIDMKSSDSGCLRSFTSTAPSRREPEDSLLNAEDRYTEASPHGHDRRNDASSTMQNSLQEEEIQDENDVELAKGDDAAKGTLQRPFLNMVRSTAQVLSHDTPASIETRQKELKNASEGMLQMNARRRRGRRGPTPADNVGSDGEMDVYVPRRRVGYATEAPPANVGGGARFSPR